MENNEETKENGGKKLVLLCCISIFITLCLTTVSLAIYHYSGDIYLDRSRPGFLPDKEEIEHRDDTEEYVFSENGPVTKYDLDEYLKMFDAELKNLDELKSPYSPEPLSDDALGIPVEKAEPAPVYEEELEEY